MTAVGARTRLLEQMVVLAIDQPDLVRHARSIGTKRHIIALAVHDALTLHLLLPHDVAEYAAFLLPEPLPRGAQFVQDPPRDEGSAGELRMRVRPLFAGKSPAVLAHGDVCDSHVALQVGDPRCVSGQHRLDLFIAHLGKFPVVLGGLHDDLVGTDRTHPVIDAVGLSSGLAFDAIQRIEVRDDADLPGPCGGNVSSAACSASWPGQSKHPSGAAEASSGWPTTTQLRVMGSLRSSILEDALS